MLRRYPSLRFAIPMILIIAAVFGWNTWQQHVQQTQPPLSPLPPAPVMFLGIPDTHLAVTVNRAVYVYDRKDVQAKSFSSGSEPAIRPGARPLDARSLLNISTVVLTGAQFRGEPSLQTEPAPKPIIGEIASLQVRLTDTGRDRLRRFTAAGAKRQLVITLNQRPVAYATVETPLNVSSFTISPIWHVPTARDLQQAIRNTQAP